MEAKTKSGFPVVQMVEIHYTTLSTRLLKELEGRELYIDSDEEINESIYSADIFEQILGEQEEMSNESPLKLDTHSLIQAEKLAEELGEYELIRVNRI